VVELERAVEVLDIFRQGHGLPVIDLGFGPAVGIEYLLGPAAAVGSTLISGGYRRHVGSVVDAIFYEIIVAINRPGPDHARERAGMEARCPFVCLQMRGSHLEPFRW
jgi:hypothetical protein